MLGGIAEEIVKSKPPTIYEVAKLAGVSPMTVTRAFNGGIRVAKETREKVLHAARVVSYKPNTLARGLRGAKTNSVVLLWSMGLPLIDGDVFYKMVNHATDKGYHLQLNCTPDTPKEVNRMLRECLSRGVDGIVLGTGVEHTDEETQSILREFDAAILITSQPISSQADQIVWDRLTAIRSVVDHFHATGRKKIGYIVAKQSDRHKVDAFISHACACGFVLDKSTIIDVSLCNNNSVDAMAKFFDRYCVGRGFDLDAILCYSDDWATVVMRSLALQGLRVPEDVAVVGFNNSPISHLTMPALATVDRSNAELGNKIEELLFARLENNQLPALKATVNMKFVLRGSAEAGGNKG